MPKAALANLPGVVYTARYARDGIVAVDWVSESTSELPGESASDLQSMSREKLMSRYHRDDAPLFATVFDQIEQTGSARIRVRLMRPDGVKWVEHRMTGLAREDGQMTVQGLMLDVTTEEEARRAFEAAHRRFEDLVALLPVGVYEDIPAGGTVYVNRRAMDFTGLGPDEMAGLGWLNGVHPEDRDWVKTRWQASVAEELVFTAEYRVLRGDGKETWVKDTATPRYAADGVYAGHVGVSVDVTESKQIEDALRFVAEKGWNSGHLPFLQKLARYLSDRTGADYVVIDKRVGAGREAETVVLLARGSILPNIRYDSDVAAEKPPGEDTLRVCPSGLQVLFPDAPFLSERDIDSYIDIPLWDGAAQLIGSIALVGGDALRQRLALAKTILRIVASRAAAVLEADRAAAHLRIAAAAFDVQQGMVVMDCERRIRRVNRAFADMTGIAPEELAGQHISMFRTSEHDDAFYARIWETVHRESKWQGEVWMRHRNGSLFPSWWVITPIEDDAGEVTHYVGAALDNSERKAQERKIERLAYFDPLTDLPNRRLLVDRLQQALTAGQRSGRHGALLFIDLDNFKVINDTAGHDAGDRLLAEVARRLGQCVRESDTVARLGGDEFVILAGDLGHDEVAAAANARIIGEKIVSALDQCDECRVPFRHAGAGISPVTASVGVTLFSGTGQTAEELLKQADIAMYQAKGAGRDALRFFDPEMQAVLVARASMESDLREALTIGALSLDFQPQIDMGTGLIGAEALLRWRLPGRGFISPAEFIPVAEETGLILPIGKWVLETACARLAAWNRLPTGRELQLAVNVSAHQFRQADFVETVCGVLERTGVAPGRLKLELTESLVLDDVGDTIEKMRALKALGVGFSMDDFGTGYSSLAYLTRLPLDQLKIDRSFVDKLPHSDGDAIVAKAVIELAHSLGLSVIAEGVETEEQRDFLVMLGCRICQGYFFGRPMAAAEFESRFLAESIRLS